MALPLEGASPRRGRLMPLDDAGGAQRLDNREPRSGQGIWHGTPAPRRHTMILLQLIYSGIALGMIYAVIAFGYQLTFATSGTLTSVRAKP